VRCTRERWSLDYDLAANGGLVLQDVKHDGFSLAKDIRVTRIWVDTEYPDRSDGKNVQNLHLNSDGLSALLPLEPPLEPPKDIKKKGWLKSPAPAFGSYHNKFGLRALFGSKDPYLARSLNECPIVVEQKYLFSDYAKDPPHEAFAVLDATRLFPLLRFEFPAVRDPKFPYPKYFRADFRLDIDLDNIDEQQLHKRRLGTDTTTNKAAIFRDKEEAPSRLGKIKIGFFGVSELFAFLEKPLTREIASWGLVAVKPPAGVTASETWDNIHMWPAKRTADIPGVESPVSTPGAFHAFHFHWRWGAVSGISPPPPGVPGAGGPMFKGIGWTKTSGGALVDEDIALQNLRFAITKSDRPEWSADRNPSERNFDRLFTQFGKPRDVHRGDNLVVWLSFEAFRPPDQLDRPWGGWLFVNGFYFAHNEDTTRPEFKLAGVYQEAVRSGLGRSSDPVLKKWERLARS
jgi:hypothetical protein